LWQTLKHSIGPQYADVTIACEDRSKPKAKLVQLKAHKLLLCVSSPYFSEMLAETTNPHPIIMVREVEAADIECILKFIYTGQVGQRPVYGVFTQICR
jgi:hypothetical protein